MLVLNTSRVVPARLPSARRAGGRPRFCSSSPAAARLGGPRAARPAPAAGHGPLRRRTARAPGGRAPGRRFQAGAGPWPQPRCRPGGAGAASGARGGTAALYPRPAGRPRALPDRLRRPPRERRSADGGAAPHPAAPGGVPPPRGGGGRARPGGRARHVPAPQGGTGRGARHAPRALLHPRAHLAGRAGRKAAGPRVVAVGTTAVRALESAAATGLLEGRTELYIRPGHTVRTSWTCC